MQELDDPNGQGLLFDPVEFYRRNPNPELAEFQLPKAELEEWGTRVTALRV